jgi:lipid A 4'-phosphatase
MCILQKIFSANSACLLALLASLLLWMWPEVDLAVSAFFYDTTTRFTQGRTGIWEFFYDLVPWLTRTIAIGIPLLYLLGRWKKRVFYRVDGRTAAFVLLALALGPGLIVHQGFKDNWGRARPSQIEQFGGEKTFSPAWVIADQCDKNCAFVSGHAAMGFFVMAFAFVYPRYRTLLLMTGVLLGMSVGFARIAGGGHFLSDVIGAGVVVYATALGCFIALYSRPLIRPRHTPPQSSE